VKRKKAKLHNNFAQKSKPVILYYNWNTGLF